MAGLCKGVFWADHSAEHGRCTRQSGLALLQQQWMMFNTCNLHLVFMLADRLWRNHCEDDWGE